MAQGMGTGYDQHPGSISRDFLSQNMERPFHMAQRDCLASGGVRESLEVLAVKSESYEADIFCQESPLIIYSF
jgi:hypothetical protein